MPSAKIRDKNPERIRAEGRRNNAAYRARMSKQRAYEIRHANDPLTVRVSTGQDGAETARLNGTAVYAGKPCKKGHDGTRYANGGKCIVCAKEKSSKYIREMLTATQIASYKKKQKEYQDANREYLLARAKENRAKRKAATRQNAQLPLELRLVEPRHLGTTTATKPVPK